MTRDEIIKMAQEANRYANDQTGDSYEWHFIRDERFAALVAAAEREACANAVERYASRFHSESPFFVEIYEAAAAIRARGEK